MKLIVDAQLPPRLAEELKQWGEEAFAERVHSSALPPIVVWLRRGNTSNAVLLEWLRPLWPEIKRRIEAGDRLIEVRDNSGP